MLRINPAMLPRLNELEADLQVRRDRASAEGWRGEIEGIDLTLRLLREKQAAAERIHAHSRVVDLGMPSIAQGAEGGGSSKRLRSSASLDLEPQAQSGR
jgi:hypothetical protein